jgi:hypothetical protein
MVHQFPSRMALRFLKTITRSILCFGATLLLSSTANAEFTHPGVIHGQDGIDFVKAKIEAGKEPWANEWKELNESKFSSLSWKPEPRKLVERGPYNRPDIGSSEFSQDSFAAYTHALHWAISGEVAHAEKAAEILDAWSGTLETITNHDAKLLIGMNGHNYVVAAELLKHTWDGWPEEKQERFGKMLRNIWIPLVENYYPTANGNWDAAMMQTMIAMGVFLDDQEIFKSATDYFIKGHGNGAVRNYFSETGQCQESGRDQAHTQMGLEFLANTCETAWVQGVDLYAAFDNRLLKGFEYTAKYNLGFDVSYEPYRSVEGRYYYRRISDDSRGRIRPMYAKVFNHYHNRMKLDAPFTKMAVERSRERSRTRASLYWDTLMFAKLPGGKKAEK